MSYRAAGWRHRSKVGALTAVIALVLVGVGWALFGHHQTGDGRHVGSGPPGSGLASSQSHATPSAGAIRPARTSPFDLAGLRWTDFYGVELPSSPSAGPRYTRGGLAWGFADTPLGALLAAVNIAVRANAQWGPGIFVATIRRQVTGPAASALLASCRATYQQTSNALGITHGQPLGRVYVSEEAFRWVNYSPANASVDIVSAGPGAQGVTVRAVTRIEIRWSGGDWRVIAPPGGDWGNSAAPLASLRGYTIFPSSSS
jgi:hypothetical protein